MKTFVVGHRGMLAQSLPLMLERSGFTVMTQGRPDVDLTHTASMSQALTTIRPDIVINAAAYTAVDQAESEPEQAYAVNGHGIQHLSETCRELGMPLIHVSTDYVFDGTSRTPYCEDDTPAPLGVYGASKWQGEAALRTRHPQHLIVRTAWLYSHSGHNFVKTMLRLGRERDVLRVVDDQHGCLTYSLDLAEAIATMCQRIRHDKSTTPWGTYHFCSAGQTTWYEFAVAIFEEAKAFEPFRVREIIPIPTTDYPTPARRPAYSVLDCSKIQSHFGITPRPWRDSLRACLQELYTCTLPETF
ncbi:dTDP-4-dehydrorhamnose reductase [Candidatus Entotheonella serta]|nr:dTDP-4-dehydrorhamnose reductase [Candidatus Entotheonella serta]